MVKKINKTQLDSLLETGAITPKEYGYLLKSSGKKDEEESEKQEEPSVAKNIVSFILTIIAIGAIMFGTCLMNVAIVEGMGSPDALVTILMIAWPLFPVILFTWIAHKTKNAGIKWAVIFLVISALLIAMMSMA